MQAIGVLGRDWMVRRRGEGWWRQTGVRREEWDRLPLPGWVHPDDGERLYALAQAMENGPATARIRIGPWRRWEGCIIEASAWTAGGAAITVRSLPPVACHTAMVVWDGVAIHRVNRAGAELFGAPASALEGAPWTDLVHPLDLAEHGPYVSQLAAGHGATHGTLVVLRCGDAWRPVKTWSRPIGDGLVRSWIVPVDPSRVLGAPPPSFVATGLACAASACPATWRGTAQA